MPRSTPSENSRNTLLHAVILVVLLVVPLAFAWGRSGPSADRAFWLVVTYFIELAAWIAIELIVRIVRGPR